MIEEHKTLIYELELNKFNGSITNNEKFGEYLSLGHFDGVNITEFSIDSNSPLPGLMPIINKHYQQRLKFEAKKDNLINQTFIIFRQEKKDSNEIEEFMKYEDWNFQFITFVHVYENNNKYDFLEKYKDFIKIENEYNKDNKIKIFDTLDNCSFISIIKSQSYYEGLEILSKIGYSVANSYCYSIVTLNKSYIKTNEEKLDIKTNFIVRDHSSINAVIKQLRNSYNERLSYGYNLGNSDVYITIKGILVKELYDLFYGIATETNSDGIYKYNAGNLINTFFSISSFLTRPMNGEFQKYRTYEKKCNVNLLNEIYDILGNNINDENMLSYNEYLFHLYKLLDGLKQILNYQYSDLAFLCIKPSLDVLSKELNVLTSENDKKLRYKDHYEYLNIAKDVLKLVVDSSYHTNHDPISNIPSNEICGKLVTFYNIIIDKIVSAFSNKNMQDGDKYKYGFLIAPRLYYITTVKVLQNTDQPKDRVLIVNTPINQVYNIKTTIITLIHECGHYVGDNARCRKERYNIILKILDIYCTNIVCKGVKEIIPEETISKDEIISKTVSYVNKKFNDKIEEIEKENNEDIKYYLVSIEKNIRDKLIDDMQSKRSELLDDICEKFESIYLAKITDYTENSIKTIQETKKLITKNYEILLRTLKTETYFLFTIFRECFADLFAILILDLNFEDYTNAFMYSIYDEKNTDISEKTKNSMYTRIAIICDVMEWNSSENNYDILKEVNYLRKKVHPEKKLKVVENQNIKILRGLNMVDVWDGVVYYLQFCKKNFDNVKGKDESHMIKQINEIYKKMNTDKMDIVSVMNEVNYQIQVFRNEMYNNS